MYLVSFDYVSCEMMKSIKIELQLPKEKINILISFSLTFQDPSSPSQYIPTIYRAD